MECQHGKESACNGGDLGSIPRLGRSTGEGIGYPLLYSWASLVAQLVKNPPVMLETWMAIINSAAMNIGVLVSLSLLVSSVCMPSSGMAGSYGSSSVGDSPSSLLRSQLALDS